MRLAKETPEVLKGFLLLADAVIITDENHIILDVNKHYEAITGFLKEDIVGLKAGFLKSTFTPKSTFQSLVTELQKGNSWSGVLINRKKSKEYWHSSITITPIIVDEERYFVGVFRELEKLKQGIYLSESKRIETQRALLKVLAISCEIRDPGIEDHLLRVQDLTEILVKAHNERLQLGLNSKEISHIIHASILHDIGKAGIPEGILYKPGPLLSFERKIIEMHPLMGAEILNKISKELVNGVIQNINVIRNIIVHHHEKWDGTGYPSKLKGEDIPFEARIVAIVDVYDALTSRRPYKDSWTREKALAYIQEQKGKQFDPMIVDTFIEYMESINSSAC